MRPVKDPAYHRPLPFQTLEKITSLLGRSSMNDRRIDQTLNLFCTSIDASAAGIYLRRYLEPEKFVFECMAKYSSNKTIDLGHVERFDPKIISKTDYGRLTDHEVLYVNVASLGLQGDFDALVIPLFLEERLFGLIVVFEVEREKAAQYGDGYVEVFSRVIELWVGKMNIDKQNQDIIDFFPNAIIGIDNKGVAQIWNPAVEKMTGWKAERIVGKGNYEYALPFYDLRRPLMADLIQHPDPEWEATYPEVRKEGDVIHCLVFTPALTGGGAFLTGSTRLMRDINNYPIGSLHIVRDITREKQIESQLHSSESMFKTITDYAGLGIALFRREKALYYNERFEAFLGISGREIVPQDLIDAVYAEDREEIRSNLEKMFNDELKGPLRLDLRAQLDNELRYYSSYAQVLDYEGKLTVYFVLDDTTEQMKLAQRARLNELKLYHEGRLTSLGIMAAGIAHELNQPLNTIRVVTDGYLYGKDEGWELDQDELFESLEMISRQVVRMSQVIQNIRNFAREDREQSFTDVGVNEAIKNVFSMIGRQLEAHNIKVVKELESELPAIKTHLNRLEQVIMNLVVNSRQALDACAHKEKELWVKTGTRNNSVFIEVGDNASGIPETLLKQIFDPFFTTKEVGQGTGLGLTISQSIVAEFGGRLDVLNNAKGGATFIVSAPLSEEQN